MMDPVLIDSHTIRLPNGREAQVGPGLTELRLEDDTFITRFHQEGRDREYRWHADASAKSAESTAWGIKWSVSTEPNVRVSVDASDSIVTFPNGTVRLPGRLCGAIQDGDRFIVSVSPSASDNRNVYAYDHSGRQLWRIGHVPEGQATFSYAAIDVTADGTIKAMQTGDTTAILDRDSGAVVGIERGRW